MKKHKSSLEPAINENSCALACLVSICRSHGEIYTQDELIQQLTPIYKDWEEHPGALVLERIINLSTSLLRTRKHTITTSKEKIIEHWQKAECLGGMLITGLQYKQDGSSIVRNHAWRLLECTKDHIKIMNPEKPKAEIVDVSWNFMQKWKGYVLLLEEQFPKIESTEDCFI